MRAGCQPTKLEPHTEMWGKLDEIVRFYLFILQLSICQEQPLTKQQWNSNSSNHYTAASIISTFRVAGAVPRASRRGCGARCRHWRRWLSSWQAQYPEPPEGPAARVVAAGAAGCLPRGRRSIQSLQKGLRRALSPLVSLAVRVAGAVPRASRRGCGARCRRWYRWLSSWEAQCPEPPEKAAARVVAAGAAGCPRGRRSTQSLQKGLRRALSPLVPRAVLVAGAVSRASRRACGARCRRWCRWLPSAWQAQYPEPPEGPAARVVAAGVAGCPRGRRSTQSLQKGLRRALSPLWRWLSAWQAQNPEPPEGAVPLAVFLVAGAVSRASRRGCGARCRRWCRWLLSAWQAQSREPPEGAVARVVAAGAAFCLPRGRRSRESLQKGLWRALSPLVPLLPRALVRALSPEFFPVAGCRRS